MNIQKTKKIRKKNKNNKMGKIKIKETIIVEGRDDTAAVKRAIDGMIIETHGFGIKRETWELIERAYKQTGIIIFTDPDYSGEEIRRRLLKKFPLSKQAFLLKEEAEKKGDIGIENASPEAIEQAIKKAHCTEMLQKNTYTEEDLFCAGLTGRTDSKQKREKMGQALGIGYSNSKSLLNKLNKFGIPKEEFYEALRAIDN